MLLTFLDFNEVHARSSLHESQRQTVLGSDPRLQHLRPHVRAQQIHAQLVVLQVATDRALEFCSGEGCDVRLR